MCTVYDSYGVGQFLNGEASILVKRKQYQYNVKSNQKILKQKRQKK